MLYPVIGEGRDVVSPNVIEGAAPSGTGDGTGGKIMDALIHLMKSKPQPSAPASPKASESAAPASGGGSSVAKAVLSGLGNIVSGFASIPQGKPVVAAEKVAAAVPATADNTAPASNNEKQTEGVG